MNTIALYLGYIVIGLVAFSLIGLFLLTLYGIFVGFYRIVKYRQTSRLIIKYETKNMYKASKIAVDFLVSKGISPCNTIGEALGMIENYRKRYKINDEKK